MQTEKNINEIATLVKALHDEKMVYSPNRSNIGPADALLNVDPTKILNSLTLSNPSSTFSVNVSVLLIKTKTDADPNNCDC